MNSEGTVLVVDDDVTVRDSLKFLAEMEGLSVQTFPSAEEFLRHFDPTICPACLVLDVKMPGIDGTELLEQLNDQDVCIPVIMLTAHADVDMAVSALKTGVWDFLQKPFSGAGLIDCIRRAIASDAEHRHERLRLNAIAKKMDSLTPREHDVVELMVLGKSTKEIASKIGTSPHTVHHQRKSILKKMDAGSVVDVVRMITTFRFSHPSCTSATTQDHSFTRSNPQRCGMGTSCEESD
jgi:two-component system, LuxR family, response regulator FixJ